MKKMPHFCRPQRLCVFPVPQRNLRLPSAETRSDRAAESAEMGHCLVLLSATCNDVQVEQERTGGTCDAHVSHLRVCISPTCMFYLMGSSVSMNKSVDLATDALLGFLMTRTLTPASLLGPFMYSYLDSGVVVGTFHVPVP